MHMGFGKFPQASVRPFQQTLSRRASHRRPFEELQSQSIQWQLALQLFRSFWQNFLTVDGADASHYFVCLWNGILKYISMMETTQAGH